MRRMMAVCGLGALLAGCGSGDVGHPHEEADEGWAVTAWGDRYEIFAEADPLVAGEVSESHTHVTVLEGFPPLREGRVAAVLRSDDGGEEVFAQDTARRDGIFGIELRPKRSGDFALAFRVSSPAGEEEIAAGRVHVGTAEAPGTLTQPARVLPDAPGVEPVSFLKEQQWRTDFATSWVVEDAVPIAIRGSARVRPPSEGARVVTAPVEATLSPSPWPHVGQVVSRDQTLFHLVPRDSGGRSLAALDAQSASLQARADAARRRVERLEELLAIEATSVAELEQARVTHADLEAVLRAARHDRDGALGQGGVGAPAVALKAPWPGRIAEVNVTPGESVSVGQTLGRLVKSRPVWIEVALSPADASRLGRLEGASLRHAVDQPSFELPANAVRVISRAPELDPETSSVKVLIEVDLSTDELPLGSAVEATLILDERRPGIVVPETAIVDDAGLPVVYVQLDGEGFARREIRVLGRLGSRVLVDGLQPGERLVLVGGAAIRRTALLSSGSPERHVH